MSREVRRVPIDFTWPLHEVWEGYLKPEELHALPCRRCGGDGHSARGRRLHNAWYGLNDFRPEDNGSTPYTPEHPAVRSVAERNVKRAPDFYGTSPAAIAAESSRLARHFNGAWCHHLNDQDVAALIAAGRLWDLTHDWSQENGWTPKTPPAVITAQDVNTWSITSMGHDGLNASVVLRARCERDGIRLACDDCDGTGITWRDAQHKAESDAWTPTQPPTGDGWQLWETVSEGSPVTPVFATAEELVAHLTTVGDGSSRGAWSREAALAMVESGWAPSGVITATGFHTNGDALLALDGKR